MASERQGGDPRNNPDDAYDTFMEMSTDEWRDLCFSLLRGGALTPAEQQGFERATVDRLKRTSGPTTDTMEYR